MTVFESPLFNEEVPEKGAAKGHVRFTMKSREPDDIAIVGFCSNVAASLLFERMQAQGTNIIITIEKESSRVDVLARHENDGLNLQWNPKPADPGDLASVQERIRNKTFFIGRKDEQKSEKKEEKAPPKPAAPPQEVKAAPVKDRDQQLEDEEDYLVKQLHRIP